MGIEYFEWGQKSEKCACNNHNKHLIIASFPQIAEVTGEEIDNYTLLAEMPLVPYVR